MSIIQIRQNHPSGTSEVTIQSCDPFSWLMWVILKKKVSSVDVLLSTVRRFPKDCIERFKQSFYRCRQLIKLCKRHDTAKDASLNLNHRWWKYLVVELKEKWRGLSKLNYNSDFLFIFLRTRKRKLHLMETSLLNEVLRDPVYYLSKCMRIPY